MDQVYINDKSGNHKLPITHENSVRDSQGTPLSTKLSALESATLEEKDYAPASYSGMGRKVLPKNMVSGVNTLTQAMMPTATGGNTVYVIQYDFTLGEDINVPANCVLEFDGGSISGNNTLTFANTGITGNPKILCNIDGTLEKADIIWFGAVSGDTTGDIGPIIEKLRNHTSHIIIPNGTFYIKTACTISAFVTDWFGEVCYNGSSTDIDVITFTGQFLTLNMTGGMLCDETIVNYTDASRTNITGLVFKNAAFGTFFIGRVLFFNTQVKVMGEGMGCSNNKFFLTILRHGNFGLLVTQKDGVDAEDIGWANENIFIGGNIGVYSRWDHNTCTAYSVACKKIYDDDHYNGVNCLTFIKQNVEGINKCAFYLENVRKSRILDIRAEHVDCLYKLVGDCRQNQIDASYDANNLPDLSGYTKHDWYPFVYSGQITTETYSIYDNDLVYKVGDVITSRGKLVRFQNDMNSVYYDIQTTAAGSLSSGLRLKLLAAEAYTTLKIVVKGAWNTRTVRLKGVEFYSGYSTTNDNCIIGGTGFSYNSSYSWWESSGTSFYVLFNKGVKRINIMCPDATDIILEYNSDVIEVINTPNYGVNDFPNYTVLDARLKELLHIRYNESDPYYYSPILVYDGNNIIQVPYNYRYVGIFIPYVAGAIYKIEAQSWFAFYVKYYDSSYSPINTTAPISHTSGVDYNLRNSFWSASSARSGYIIENPVIQGAAYMTLSVGASSGGISLDDIVLKIRSNVYQRSVPVMIPTEGTTSERPTQDKVWSGYEYFDITIGKPIYVVFTARNTIKWVDAAGNDV